MRYLASIAIASSLVVAQNIDLDTIVVTATKSEQKLQDVTSNITVITKEELEEKHITTVAEALSQAQGLIVSQSGGVGQTTSIFLRGFSSQYTVVLIDGVKFNDPSAPGAMANISSLTVDDIERIEIVKGPQSGIYGADAAAGVINIITKKPSNRCNASINLEYGKYDTKKLYTSISKKINNLSLLLSYSKFKTDGFSAQANLDEKLSKYEDDGFDSKSYTLKAIYDFSKKDKLSLTLNKTDSNTEFDDFGGDSNIPHTKEIDKIFNISYKHSYSEKSYTKVSYSKTSFKRDITDLNFMKQPTSTQYKGEIKEYSIDNKINFNSVDILFGLSQQKSKDFTQNKELKATGAYVTAIAKFNNTIASATIRRDHYNNYKDKTTGKIGLKHTFDNGLIVSANYGTAYRVPSLNMYGSLKPETTKGYDISLEYKNFSLTYFNNKIENMFIFDRFDFITQKAYYKNGDDTSKIKGFELGYKGMIANDLFYSLNYTRFIAKDAQGKQLLRRPSYIINASLDYYGFKNTHINLNAQYIGKREDLAFDPVTFTSKKVQTGKVFTANMSIDYKVNDNVTAYLKIDNITDKKYQDVAGYATSGRAIYVGVNAKF